MKRFIFQTLLFFTASFTLFYLPLGAAEVHKFALCVGINEYANPDAGLDKLDYAKNDAEKLAEQLRAIGFQQENIIVLTDGGAESKRPTKANILNAVETLRKRAALKDGDCFFWFSFSGHGGTPGEGGDKKSYIYPIDTTDNFTESGIPIDRIYEETAKFPASHKLLVIDACRNEPGKGSKSVSIREKPKENSACILLQSCSPGEKSYEPDNISNEDQKHGYFTRAVLKALRGEALQPEVPQLRIRHLINYVVDNTFIWSGNKQHPDYLVSPGDKSFRELSEFVLWERTLPPPVPAYTPSAGDLLVLSVDGMEYRFRWCPPGKFTMGSSEKERDKAVEEYTDEKSKKKYRDWMNDETQHEVHLTKGFWLAETETTVGQFRQFIKDSNHFKTTAEKEGNAYGFKDNEFKTVDGLYWDSPGFKQDDSYPVTCVSYDDIRKADGSNCFLRWLNGKQAKIVRIESKNGKRVFGDYSIADYKFELPTESQWEYACRAGTTTPFHFGSVLNGDKANCDGNYPYGTTTKGKYLEKTAAVGSYPANVWGLYDMHGNVLEWCSDWYGAYPTGSVTDPTGATSGSLRVNRGGGWFNGARSCRSAYRSSSGPSDRNFILGLRLSLVSESE